MEFNPTSNSIKTNPSTALPAVEIVAAPGGHLRAGEPLTTTARPVFDLSSKSSRTEWTYSQNLSQVR